MGRTLVIIGLTIAAVGMLISMGVPFGRLPGDLTYRHGNFSFHFPIVTMIVVSIVLSLLLSFFFRR